MSLLRKAGLVLWAILGIILIACSTIVAANDPEVGERLGEFFFPE